MDSKAPQTSVGSILYEVVDAFAVVLFYGPPILFLAVPWLLFAVLLSAPFALAVLAVARRRSPATTLLAGAVTLLRRAVGMTALSEADTVVRARASAPDRDRPARAGQRRRRRRHRPGGLDALAGRATARGVRDPAAFLATTTTRLALNVGQSARVRHETVFGPPLAELGRPGRRSRVRRRARATLLARALWTAARAAVPDRAGGLRAAGGVRLPAPADRGGRRAQRGERPPARHARSPPHRGRAALDRRSGRARRAGRGVHRRRPRPATSRGLERVLEGRTCGVRLAAYGARTSSRVRSAAAGDVARDDQRARRRQRPAAAAAARLSRVVADVARDRAAARPRTTPSSSPTWPATATRSARRRRSTTSAHSKRAMALDQVEAMAQLGFDAFAVAGHDRGGRVAYRMALDHPEPGAAARGARHRPDRRGLGARWTPPSPAATGTGRSWRCPRRCRSA